MTCRPSPGGVDTTGLSTDDRCRHRCQRAVASHPPLRPRPRRPRRPERLPGHGQGARPGRTPDPRIPPVLPGQNRRSAQAGRTRRVGRRTRRRGLQRRRRRGCRQRWAARVMTAHANAWGCRRHPWRPRSSRTRSRVANSSLATTSRSLTSYALSGCINRAGDLNMTAGAIRDPTQGAASRPVPAWGGLRARPELAPLGVSAPRAVAVGR